MVSFKKLCKKNERFMCTNCKRIFCTKEIKLLTPSSDNIKMISPPGMYPFQYIDKDGKCMGGVEQPSKAKGDRVLSCPHCGYIHLFGFPRAYWNHREMKLRRNLK